MHWRELIVYFACLIEYALSTTSRRTSRTRSGGRSGGSGGDGNGNVVVLALYINFIYFFLKSLAADMKW